MENRIKQELVQSRDFQAPIRTNDSSNDYLIELTSSDSDSNASDDSNDSSTFYSIKGKRHMSREEIAVISKKKQKMPVILPPGFLDPLLPDDTSFLPPRSISKVQAVDQVDNDLVKGNKQFWKAGDYEGDCGGNWETSTGGMDHVRVHPKFLHSNATSHKWCLGAFAELLDNALDEVSNGATYVNIDMIRNKKDTTRMLYIEDNGGGMDPDKMRQCMSLGYSVKSKLANTIGQYGNGFKTSTMRLGADVIVFSRCCGQSGKEPTQSIGLLSYTFLRSTKKEDIIVPMLDYERVGNEWRKITRSSRIDWNNNLETIVQWSPYSSEVELLKQFNRMKDHGTSIIIYNLWEDDSGQLELDFHTNLNDIQIRGVNRDEKKIQMAEQFPNSRHFLTYRHSLRSYVSILYLRLPPGFRIIIRGKDVEHHNLINDMMLTQEITYRPQPGADGVSKDSNIVAVVTVGFVKDAKFHIDVQGFNVYHKNRLIKPFWRIWNAAGSDGRGVVGLLEANFVEPAHDKQGFERTTVLARLEARLIIMQKNYWRTYCHKIGYAPRRNKNSPSSSADIDYVPETASFGKRKPTASSSKTPLSNSQQNQKNLEKEFEKSLTTDNPRNEHGSAFSMEKGGVNIPSIYGRVVWRSPSTEIEDDENILNERPKPSTEILDGENTKKSNGKYICHSNQSSPCSRKNESSQDTPVGNTQNTPSKDNNVSVLDNGYSSLPTLQQLEEENRNLRERFKKKDKEILGGILHDLQKERDRANSLEHQLKEAKQKIEEMDKEQESLVIIISEERRQRDSAEEKLKKELQKEKDRRDLEEVTLRDKLKEASTIIQELIEKVRVLEARR